MPIASIHQGSAAGNADGNISIVSFPLVRFVKVIAGGLHSFVNVKFVRGQLGVIHANGINDQKGISLRQSRLLIEPVGISFRDPKAILPFGEFC